MRKFKKRLSSVLAILVIAMTFLNYMPAKATESIAEVAFLGVEHSPLVVGDSETFYLSAIGAEKVQYRVFQNKIGSDKWEELTSGYTNAKSANDITKVNGSSKYEAGKYKLSVWVKKADVEGKFKNKNGDYDSYYVSYLNCVSKDNNNRVYSNGDMDVEKDSYMVGETVKVSGIKDISGMKDPYTYKLHIYDVNSNAWKFDNEAYRKDLSFLPDKPGTYVLDVWAMSSNSTLWDMDAKLNGRIYEAWKLKVITVTEKIVEPEITEVNIKENGTIYGSLDVKNPMQVNKNVNVTANDVVLNNASVKGNVTVTGNKVTLNNVKVEGNLILNPGENGTVNLNNVNADTVQVLSGAANSIHFNNVNAKELNVNSKNLKEIVRIELKGKTSIEKTKVLSNAILDAIEGSFGNIEVLENQNKAENLVELRGSFDKNITVKTKATLKTAKDAKVSKVVIEPANNEKITLHGNFGEIEVNKKAVIATTENTKIEKITTNSSGVTLEVGKGSTVITLDQKGQIVTPTGAGKVEKKINPPAPTPTAPREPREPREPSVPPTPTTIYVTGVSLNKTTAELTVGNLLELTATINPSNATNQGVTWTSSNGDVAVVTGITGTKANVTAKTAGTTIITVTTEDGKKTATCEVKVVEKEDLVKVETVSIDQETVSLAVGEPLKLTATVKPDNATNKKVTWKSSNEAVATVIGSTGETANVTAKTAGTATITVTTEDGGKTATCEITVTAAPTPDTELNAKVNVEGNKVTVSVDNSNVKNQVITITLYDKANDKLVFINELIADLSGKGIFNTSLETGKYYGFVKAAQASLITRLDFDVVKTGINVDTVMLDQETATVAVGEPLKLTATVKPDNAANKNVTWKSSNETVATVTGSTGTTANVTAKTAGTATITVTTEDGGKAATCEITVTAAPTPETELNAKVNVEGSKVTVSVDNSNVKNQVITITMYDKSNDKLVFINELIADLSGKGTFNTSLEKGKYYGFVKAAQASLITKLDFEIVQTGIKVEGVSLNKIVDNTTGQSIELVATINPSDATNKNVTWKSSNEAVATVTNTGLNATVTAKTVGTTTITVTTEDGEKTATCIITVKDLPTTDTELNAKVNSVGNKVTVLVDNIKVANQQITVAIYKANDDIAFIDQLTADSAGKGTFNTILDAGKYHGLVKASKADLSTKLDFEIVQTGIKVETVSLNKIVANTTGQSIELVATINPSDATNKNVTWKSSNEAVATVTNTGLNATVTAKTAGTTTITVTTEDGEKTATCAITVTTTTSPAIELNADVKIEEKKVTVSVNNIKVANQQITIAIYKANDDIAFIDQLTADSAGKGTFNTILDAGKYHGLVKASKADLSTKLDFEIVQTGIKVETVSLNKIVANTTGQSIELVATINPSDATNKNVTWKSSNEAVATVTNTGLNATVTAKTAGTTTITVTTEDGEKTATCAITVTTSTSPAIGLNATVNVTENKVTVSVDNNKVENQQVTITAFNEATKKLVFIDQLTADSAGKGTFNTILDAGKYHGLVKASKADLSTKLDFDIVQTGIKVEGVSLNKIVANTTTGQSIELVATINPSDATNKNVTWKSSNEAVATVTGSVGTTADVKAIGEGTATITVTSEDGEKTATCEITVITITTSAAIEINVTETLENIKVETVTFDKADANLMIAETLELIAIINPDYATNQKITWKSSNEDVATVTGGTKSEASVIAISEGTATITVTTEDGERTATIIITVVGNLARVNTVSFYKPTVKFKVAGLL